MGAPKIYSKADLRKLADSKAVPLIAHSHEVIVPVVYSGMVKKFLEDKGVKLPLTQAQLAEMKKEAKAVGSKDVGHAKGGTVKQSMKNTQAVNQKVVVNIGTRRGRGKRRVKRRITKESTLIGGPSLYDQLRPSAWTAFRPITTSGFSNPLFGDTKKEAEEHYKKEREAVDKYKTEVEQKARDSLKELDDKKKQQEELFSSLFRPAESMPIRSGHSSFPSSPAYSGPATPQVPSSPAYSGPATPQVPSRLLPKRSAVDISTPEPTVTVHSERKGKWLVKVDGRVIRSFRTKRDAQEFASTGLW